MMNVLLIGQSSLGLITFQLLHMYMYMHVLDWHLDIQIAVLSLSEKWLALKTLVSYEN